MELDELLGQPLSLARRILGEQLLAVQVTGFPGQSLGEDEHQLRVVRVRQSPTGCVLTVVLPPVLEKSF